MFCCRAVACLVCILSVCGIAGSVVVNGTSSVRRKRSAFSRPVCYGDLGCFPTGPPFYHPVWRPLSAPPLLPAVQGTTFHLYTRHTKDRPLVFTPRQMRGVLPKSGFDPGKWTRVLVHGVFDGVKLSSWMKASKDNYLEMDDENVILVDHGSKVPPFFLNAANARVIGAQIWLLIDYLQKYFGANPETFHLIGHSLGAHIAGYAGERLLNLGRITGLDPAGPYFRNVPNVVKLDPGDALFVDVIHTNPGRNILEGVGTIEDVGHVNFWPSGGKPGGCVTSPLRALTTGVFPTEFLQNTFLCRHFRAPDFFRSSQQGACLFVGAECPSWEEFTLGRCHCGTDGQRCRIMGQYATPATYESRYYLQVGKERPYCLHQYQVIVYLEVPPLKSYASFPLLLDLDVDAGKGFRDTLRFSLNLMEDRQFKTFLLTFKQPVGRVYSVAASLHLPHRRSNLTVSIAAIEINYLFPLPKKEISNLMCKEKETALHREIQTFLSPRACKTLQSSYDSESDTLL